MSRFGIKLHGDNQTTSGSLSRCQGIKASGSNSSGSNLVDSLQRKGKRNLHSQLFLKHDGVWDIEWCSNLCRNNIARTSSSPQKLSGTIPVVTLLFSLRKWYEYENAATSSCSFDTVFKNLDCSCLNAESNRTGEKKCLKQEIYTKTKNTYRRVCRNAI